MPVVMVEESNQRTAHEKQHIMQLIFSSIKRAFGVTDDELQGRYSIFEKENFFSPENRQDYVHINIVLFKGRSIVSKKKLYKDIVEHLSDFLQSDPESILIVLDERESENWGMKGGYSATDLSFDYDINV